ncbi:MAG: hypothetical protein M1358_12005 [Chloroflexi bacterium]|nr:hypothetical protein [Chloroflexota bacterium]
MKQRTWGQSCVIDVTVGFELLVGLAASIVGAVGSIWAAFGPISHRESAPSLLIILTSNESWLPSIGGLSISPVTFAFVTVMLLCAVGIAIGAYRHSRYGIRAGLALLWLSSIIFSVGVIISDLSIAVFLLPSARPALMAAVSGSFAELWSISVGMVGPVRR